MAEPALALPAAGGERPRGLLRLGVLFLAASGAMLFGALIAAYLRLRALTDPWPPKGVKIDLYLGNTMAITVLMAAVTMEWACQALRRNHTRQVSAALGLTIGFALAVLNLLSYTAGRVRFDAASHPYGLVTTAMVMVLGILVGVGVAVITLTLFRVAGRQITAAEPEALRVAACFWYFLVAASLAVWYTVVVLK